MFKQPPANECVAHEYGPSRIGHGEAQCRWCLGTNRENAIIAPNHCQKRADALASDQTEQIAEIANCSEASTAGLAAVWQTHVEAADRQVATGQFGQECIAFGAWTWENRHRILTALTSVTTADDWRDLAERSLLQLAALDSFMKFQHGTSAANRTQLIADLEQRLGVKASATVTKLGGDQ